MSDADQTPEPAPDASPDLPPGDSPAPTSYESAPVVQEQRSSRLPLVLATVGAVLVLGAALAAPLVDRALRGEEEAQRALDLTLVETWDITDREHTTDDVTYPQDPPAGGAHAPIWLDCGVYDVPVRDENAVHDLEHGSVWITHDPDLSAGDVETLTQQLPDNGIMSPREGLPSPVVVTVWGAQLQLDGADDERLGLFLEEYGDGHTAPEFGVAARAAPPIPPARCRERASTPEDLFRWSSRQRADVSRPHRTGSRYASLVPRSATRPARDRSVLQEAQQRLVELIGVAHVEAVRGTLDDDHLGAADRPLTGALARALERHDAVGVAVDDQRGDRDLGQVVTEVGGAEGLHGSPGPPSGRSGAPARWPPDAAPR